MSRAIGVSNYSVRHLEELRAHSDVVPAVDQVELHPFVYDPDLLAYCGRHGSGSRRTPRSPGASSSTTPRSPRSPRLTTQSPAQVLLRWGLQHGVVVLPRSIRAERIQENGRLFDFALTNAEMARLDGLRGGPRVTAWNPADIP